MWLLPEGEPLCYQATVAGRRYATEWVRHRRPTPAAGHELELLIEVDPAVLGAGGATVCQRTWLRCDDEGEPLQLTTWVGGASLELRFSATVVVARLPDGSQRDLGREAGRFVVDSMLAGLEVLMWAALHRRGELERALDLVLFDATTLRGVPYRIEPVPGGYHSSHEEDVVLDDHGLVRSIELRKQGLETRRVVPPLPLPAWSEGALPLGPAPLRYAPPAGASFSAREVTIVGPATPLGATVTVPAGAAPFPAVLFLSGSGTHDRHGFAGEIDTGSHEIVDALAEAGLLGLRYDSRGAGRTRIGEDLFDQGLETVIADGRAALHHLLALTEVDPRRVFLLGHSQGAVVALALAAEAPGAIAGIVLLAGPARDLGAILVDQVRQQGQARGLPAEVIDNQVAETSRFVELVRSGAPWQAGEVPDRLFAAGHSRRWLSEHLARVPTAMLGAVSCPVLIMQGDADFQVSPEQDAEVLAQAARAAGRDVELVRLPGLDHLFKAVAEGGVSTLASYYDRSRHVDRAFLARLTGWLTQRARG